MNTLVQVKMCEHNSGTGFADIRFIPKTSEKIVWHKAMHMPTSSATLLVVIQCFMFSASGCPSPSISSQSSVKRLSNFFETKCWSRLVDSSLSKSKKSKN